LDAGQSRRLFFAAWQIPAHNQLQQLEQPEEQPSKQTTPTRNVAM
jgi:hypothetical protein